MKMKPSIIVTISLMALAAAGQAATVSVSVAQSLSGVEGSTPINLTAQGPLDWGIWATAGTLTPSDSMDGGAGFNGLTLISGATQHPGSFGNPENGYSWTNGTAVVSTTGITNAARANFNSVGDGVSLTIDIASAGSYQLKFHTSTSGIISLNGTASLLTGGVTDTAFGVEQTLLAQSEYTVNFTTDGADTLTLNVIKAGGASTIFAYEAVTLASVPEPSSIALLGLGGLALISRRRL